jgi:small subunit ribosomal protein S15e
LNECAETIYFNFQAAAELKKKRTFRKFTYRGVDLDQLLDMNNEQLMELLPCRIRRKFGRGIKRKPMALIKKLRKKKKECPVNEKPDVVKTHLRDMVVVPEMTGSIVGVYNGKTFNQVEIKVSYDQRCSLIRGLYLLNNISISIVRMM